MLQEISKAYIAVSKQEEPFIKWCNSVLSIRVDKGIQLFEFEQNLQCFDKNIRFLSVMLPNSKASVLKDLIPENFSKKIKSNLEIAEMIQDRSLWPHHADIVDEMASFSDFQWSPIDMVHNNECILATLNSFGNVEFYGRSRHGWENMLDLSNVNLQRLESSNSITTPKNIKQLKTLADLVETTSLCWGPKVNIFSSFFAMAQKNGNILIWCLQNENKLKVTFIGEAQTDTEVIAMTWIQKSTNNFLLIYSNILGETFALNCIIEQYKLHVISRNSLWTYKDKMVTKCFNYKLLEDRITLTYPKHRFLVVQLIDANGNVISQFVDKANDYRITDVVSNNNGTYLTTINGNVYKINTDDVDNNLKVSLNLIKLKDWNPKYELYGVAFSNNSVILALAVINTQVAFRKQKKYVEIIFVMDSAISETSILLDNPTKTLTDYWDCIELLRYKTMKARSLPPLDYNALYEKSDTDLYKLKLYLIITDLANNLKQFPRQEGEIMLPETSSEFIREKILAKNASSILSELFSRHRMSYKKLKGLNLESYSGAKNYLLYFCEKYKKNITDFAADNILDYKKIIQNTCQCCDDKIQGMTCESGHVNMFCVLTFASINSDDYLVCKVCASTARSELYADKPKCIFCDLLLRKV